MYDAIVVGARCAGSPTATLLARLGYRVLLVDRARFPSDTISTHFIWPPGVACLRRWGLLDKVLATGCPAFRTIGLDVGEFQLEGDLPPIDGGCDMLAPRRTVLDKLLLDAAAAAGAEVREGFTATGLISSGEAATGVRGRSRQGGEIEERARLVIGADGRNSLVARAVSAAEYDARPSLTCAYYAYWRDVAPHLPAIHTRPRRTVISFPTNDGLTITPIIAPREEFQAIRADLDGFAAQGLGLVADFAEPFRDARRVEPIRGTGTLPNFFRKPYGPGWALVGDAGYHKDPILAQGISDAFRCAEWLAEAVHAGFSGDRPLAEALAGYQRKRDECLAPMYGLTCSLASFEPPPPETLALYEALRSNAAERSRFFGTLGGTVPIAEYYAPENLQRILAGSD
ncbi:MAG TPA: FAD-dependent monooxygenase [Stellaceae bacterium]|nr:FAD-dependent monooxygenase [Stellaceae bacterium]